VKYQTAADTCISRLSWIRTWMQQRLLYL